MKNLCPIKMLTSIKRTVKTKKRALARACYRSNCNQMFFALTRLLSCGRSHEKIVEACTE